VLDNIAFTHFRSRETLFKLAQEFGERINIWVVEKYGDEPARAISLAELASKRGKSVDHLRKLAHTLFVNEFGNLEVDHPEIYEPSSKKVLAAKVRRRAVPAEEKNVANRVVESIVTGFNTFRHTGKFPKVY